MFPQNLCSQNYPYVMDNGVEALGGHEGGAPGKESLPLEGTKELGIFSL